MEKIFLKGKYRTKHDEIFLALTSFVVSSDFLKSEISSGAEFLDFN